ncbi:MAG: peptidase M3 [Myxococcales bacterium]|nr:peptidase M3 [Myxococcales bacterium]
METSINALAKRLDSFLFDLASLHYRYGAGLATELPVEHLYREYPELTRPETFRQVRESVEDKRTDERERTRMRLLLEFLAGQVEEAIAAPSQEEIATLEASATVPTDREPLALREAVARLPREAERERRGMLEQGIGELLWENQTPYARRREAAVQTAEALGYSSYLALRDAVTGFSAEALAQECEKVLLETEDAYRDVLGYVLRKVDPGVRPVPAGNARRHDLQRAATAPWMAQHFRREDLLPSVTRCLGEMGLPPNAEGRILLDTEERPGKTSRAFVADLKVPDDIRLVVRPGGGLDDYFSLLHEFGHAQQLAHVSPHAPVEERRLGDLSVTEGFAYLFDHLLLDPAWHRRYLHLSTANAKEAARISAFNNLWLLRRYAAKLPYELELYARGPERPLAEEYEERMARALSVKVHRGFYLYDVDPQLYATRYLRAWAFEARLYEVLVDRYNEDFWRNPAAGSWLKDLFARGQRDDAGALAGQLGGRPLSLSEAGRRLVQVMGS